MTKDALPFNAEPVKLTPALKAAIEQFINERATSLVDTLVSIDALNKRYDNKRSTIYRWIKESNFPTPIILGHNTARWKFSEVLAWEAQAAAARKQVSA